MCVLCLSFLSSVLYSLFAPHSIFYNPKTLHVCPSLSQSSLSSSYRVGFPLKCGHNSKLCQSLMKHAKALFTVFYPFSLYLVLARKIEANFSCRSVASQGLVSRIHQLSLFAVSNSQLATAADKDNRACVCMLVLICYSNASLQK